MPLKQRMGLAPAYRMAVVLIGLLATHLAFGQQGSITHYRGRAEASAAAVLDNRHFVVAEDECNTLLVYRFGETAPVGKPVDLAGFLQTGDKASDIEAAARIGNTIFWISSHSVPKSGKVREWRRRFFATEVVAGGTEPPTVRPVGQPFTGLVDAMGKAKGLAALKLGKAAKLPPEGKGGLNIEGLAEWKEGLLLGLRNPLQAGKALLIPLRNPDAVVLGKEPPSFGQPVLLDLGGRGVRSIDRVKEGYVIVAGPVADAGSFALYRWSGNADDAPMLSTQKLPAGLVPEAAVVVPGEGRLMLLSDDGALNKEVACGAAAKASQSYRAMVLAVP